MNLKAVVVSSEGVVEDVLGVLGSVPEGVSESECFCSGFLGTALPLFGVLKSD